MLVNRTRDLFIRGQLKDSGVTRLGIQSVSYQDLVLLFTITCGLMVQLHSFMDCQNFRSLTDVFKYGRKRLKTEDTNT